MADNVVNLQRAELAKLPFFSASKSDNFTCEVWVERVDRNKATSNWDDATTMTYVFNALRGEALEWTRTLNHRPSIDPTNWNSFKKGLLAAFSTVRTSRTTTINMSNLQQGHTEKVTTFCTRVVNTVNDFESLHGPAPIGDNPWTGPMQAIPELMAAPVAQRAAQLQFNTDRGAKFVYNNLALTLFVCNLRPAIRDEVTRQRPTTLEEASDIAVEYERSLIDPKKPSVLPMMPVDSEPTADAGDTEESLQAELDDLQADNEARVEAIKKKMSRFRRPNPTNSRPAGQQPPKNNGNQSGQRNNNKRNITCRYCNIRGHFQVECKSRLRDKAPMVDGNGRAYGNRQANVVEDSQPPAAAAAAAAPAPQVVYVPYPQQYNQFAGQFNPDFQ